MSKLPIYHAQRSYSVADLASSSRVQENSDYYREKFEEGFDWTTTRVLGQELRQITAEAAFSTMGRDVSRRMTKDEISASPYFRDGVEYRDGMTEGEVIQDSMYYDMRRRREAVIANQPLNETAVLGFGMMMLGSLPSAEALIGGAAVKGGLSVGMNAARAAGSNMLVTGVADIPVVNTLRQQGEEAGVADIVLDMAFAGILGAGFAIPGARKSVQLDKLRGMLGNVENKIADLAAEGGESAARLSERMQNFKADVARMKEGLSTADAQVRAEGDITKVNLSENQRLKQSVEDAEDLAGVRSVEEVIADHVAEHGEKAPDKPIKEPMKAVLDDRLDTTEPPPVEQIKAEMDRKIIEAEKAGFADEDEWMQESIESFMTIVDDRANYDADVKARRAASGGSVYDVADPTEAVVKAYADGQKRVEAKEAATIELLEGGC